VRCLNDSMFCDGYFCLLPFASPSTMLENLMILAGFNSMVSASYFEMVPEFIPHFG